ncbi:MAG: hypothetical protein EPN23_00805 [Verrucomicrobia bacterium]|nr:MAG: hypothetical protein EPN23_00805 [Verrucomicrobiota bacterium]
MALTAFQRDICRILAVRRHVGGESYVAGGLALNELLRQPRRSRDVDLFHDTEQALAATWVADRAALETAGYSLRVVRETPSFVEALVMCEGQAVLIQWARDSAFRFFPLVEDVTLGLTLHPLDLAANKVLALVGRLEPRDWVDVLACDEKLQPLGYLVWAACGKDPGFSPAALLSEARRSSRYTQTELNALDFDGEPPAAAVLARRWHAALQAADKICAWLPDAEVGKCVLTTDGNLCRASPEELRSTITLQFHSGNIGGAWPRIVEVP